MCQQITKKGVQCKREPNEIICNLHKKLQESKYKTKEVINLNKTIQRKSNEIKSLKSIIEKQKEELEIMKSDYDNYQFIKTFELIKTRIKSIIYDKIEDINYLNSFLDNEENEQMLTSIFNTDKKPFSMLYNELRVKRNILSHSY